MCEKSVNVSFLVFVINGNLSHSATDNLPIHTFPHHIRESVITLLLKNQLLFAEARVTHIHD